MSADPTASKLRSHFAQRVLKPVMAERPAISGPNKVDSMKPRRPVRGHLSKLRHTFAAFADSSFSAQVAAVYRAVRPPALTLPIPEDTKPETARLVVVAQLAAVEQAQREIADALVAREALADRVSPHGALLSRDRDMRLADIEVRTHIWRRLAERNPWHLAHVEVWLLRTLSPP